MSCRSSRLPAAISLPSTRRHCLLGHPTLRHYAPPDELLVRSRCVWSTITFCGSFRRSLIALAARLTAGVLICADGISHGAYGTSWVAVMILRKISFFTDGGLTNSCSAACSSVISERSRIVGSKVGSCLRWRTLFTRPSVHVLSAPVFKRRRFSIDAMDSSENRPANVYCVECEVLNDGRRANAVTQ